MPLELLHNTVIDGNLTLTNNGDLSVRGIAASGNVRLTGVSAATQGTAVMIDAQGNLSKRLLGSLAYSSDVIPTNNNQLTNGAGYLTRADNFYLDGITKSGNILTFSVNGAANQQYTFGSNAFNSTTIPTNNNQLTNGAGYTTGAGYLQLSGGTMTGDLVTVGATIGNFSQAEALYIRGSGPARIKFSDHNTSSGQQVGYLDFYHSDGSSQGGGASFWFKSNQDDLVLAVGDANATHGRVAVWSGHNAAEVDYGFVGDVNTGLYSPANHQVGLTANGSRKLLANSSGITIQNGRLYLNTVDRNEASSEALVLNGTEVEKRTLGSNAFNSTTIPTNNNQLTNGAGYTTFDGNYNSLSNRPTIPTNNNQLTNGAGYTTNRGTVTNVTVGTGLDVANGNTSPNITLDLSELTDMTAPINTSQDELILLDNGAERRKRFSEIFGSNAYNSTTIPTNNNQLTNGAGYVTSNGFVDSASFSTTTGVLTLSGRDLPANVTVDLDGRYLQTPSSFQQVTNAGNSTSNTISAPRYNDYNSSTYYLDPSSASRMNDINVNYLDVQANDAYALRFWGGSTNYAIRMSRSSNSTYGGRVPGETSSDYNMYFRMSGGTNRGFVFQNGTNERAGIDGAGNFRTVGNVIAYSSSDKRLKDNIIPIKGALDIVNSIGGYKFDWNEEKQDTFKGKDVGVIAQEVKELVPEIVTEREDGMLAVKYEKLVPVLIEAIKELTEEVNELKYRLDNHKL